MASKDLVVRANKALEKIDDKTFSQDVGGALVLAGGGGMGLMFAASFIPFIGPWLIMIAAVTFGIFLYLK